MDADLAGLLSCVSRAKVDTLSVKAEIIPPCNVSCQNVEIQRDEQALSLNYHYDSNGVRQYRVRTEHGLVFEMRLPESDAREVEMDPSSITDLLHRKFD